MGNKQRAPPSMGVTEGIQAMETSAVLSVAVPVVPHPQCGCHLTLLPPSPGMEGVVGVVLQKGVSVVGPPFESRVCCPPSLFSWVWRGRPPDCRPYVLCSVYCVHFELLPCVF
ncbi:hypothetical protein UPYG_G00026710 [Umbra pygmaea]|uniref:Uncharacterized protein n=1 Tax=Umbra pygmaea TaxID=75934 RepID=A0ABD0YAZ9_UMBPY